MKVDFLIAGSQKCGTTALDGYLREHPEICMADIKEVHFFDNDDYFVKGEPDYVSLYHPHFSACSGSGLVGEATPIYMYWKSAPERIFRYNGAMKIIMLLRNPIERAYSQWNMEWRRGLESATFTEAIRREIDRLGQDTYEQHRVFSYCDRGFYSVQIERMWKFLPKEQTLFIKSDWLREFPKEALSSVYDFLGVSSMAPIRAKVMHELPYAGMMSEDDKRVLRELFEPDIRRLECMLDWDCSGWILE